MRRCLLAFTILCLITLSGCSLSKSSTITLTGSIEGNSTNISSEIASEVIDVKKSEGDAVNADDVVYTLDNTTLNIQKKQMENQIAALKVQVKVAMDRGNSDSVKIAEYNLKSAEKSLDVINKNIDSLKSSKNNLPSNLTASVNAADDNLLKLELQREQTGNQIEALKLQLSNVKSSGNDNVKIAEYNLKAAEESLALINENIKKSSAASPVSGVITSTNFNKGEMVPLGAVLFTVLDNKNLYLRIFVPERYLSEFKVGDKVNVNVPSISDKSYTGSVVKIDEQGQFTPKNTETVDEKSDVVFGVKLKVEGDGILKPGMIAEVKINAKQ